MSELLLVICVVFPMLFAVFGVYYLPTKLQLVLRMIMGVALLTLLWYSEKSRLPLRFALALFVLPGLINAIGELRKNQGKGHLRVS